MLNDGMNSVMRMYTSSFSDYFSQACIDYFLGHRTTSVFSEFLLKLSSTDPREMHRLSKIRAAAIETSASLVIYSGEQMLSGWTLISPMEFNVRAGVQFGEKVLLLVRFFCIISVSVHLIYEPRPTVHCISSIMITRWKRLRCIHELHWWILA